MPRANREIALILWITSVLGMFYAALDLSPAHYRSVSTASLSLIVVSLWIDSRRRRDKYQPLSRPVVIVISCSMALALVFGITYAWLNDGPLALRASRLIFVCMFAGNGATLLQPDSGSKLNLSPKPGATIDPRLGA